jgi:5-methylcytosine-specific restriction endonuclease McrA
MAQFRAKKPRIRLSSDKYKKLCQLVLVRDAWRCQICGSSENLQVHHLRPRSRLGDDSPSNLITLCSHCHALQHKQLRSEKSDRLNQT